MTALRGGGIRLAGKTWIDEVVPAVARTLGVDRDALDVRLVTVNERQTAAHVRVDFGRDRLFAKVLLQARVPRLTPQFLFVPSEDSAEYRSASDQIRRESESAERLRLLSRDGAGVRVPRVRAASESERVIVWDRVEGVTLEHLLKRSRNAPAAARQIGGAVGIFLRCVHGESANGRRKVFLKDTAEMTSLAETITPGTAPVLARTLGRLRAMLDADGAIELPTTFVHGDLSLSNLMWDERDRRLTVVDFEHARDDAAVFDLTAWIYGLRVCLFWPRVHPETVRQWESGFTDAYGDGADRVYRTAELMAVAWLFGYFLPERVPGRERLSSGLARLQRVLYRRFLRDRLIAKRLRHLTGGFAAGGFETTT
jgi:tRNA A-37 threonylcarbamoyl transferase component Bud32